MRSNEAASVREVDELNNPLFVFKPRQVRTSIQIARRGNAEGERDRAIENRGLYHRKAHKEDEGKLTIRT